MRYPRAAELNPLTATLSPKLFAMRWSSPPSGLLAACLSEIVVVLIYDTSGSATSTGD
jgi:hypothetical protein